MTVQFDPKTNVLQNALLQQRLNAVQFRPPLHQEVNPAQSTQSLRQDTVQISSAARQALQQSQQAVTAQGGVGGAETVKDLEGDHDRDDARGAAVNNAQKGIANGAEAAFGKGVRAVQNFNFR